MPVTTDQPAPYAPASAIIDLIERHRNKGLPPVVDADVLLRAGISDSLVPRTLQAMKTLDLLDAEGRPTQVFEGIRLAPTAEYEQRLAEWLNAAYADALSFVDPASDDEVEFRDAFRKYIPTGQQPRMVSLFMGLFTAAGVMPPRQRQTTPRTSASGAGGVTKSRSSGHARSRSGSDSKFRSQSGGGSVTEGHNRIHSPALPPAISGLLASLPSDGRWTQAQRDKFMTAFPVMLDYAFEVVEETAKAKTAFDR